MARPERLPGQWLELPGAQLYYEPEFLDTAAANHAMPGRQDLYDTLVDNVPWRRDEIVLFGRRRPVPRLSAWYGDAGAFYRYSGIALTPLPWLAPLAALREFLQRHLALPFNSVLLNYYRDGDDSMGAHSDDEPELGPRPQIAMISLGARRRFALTPRRPGAAEPWRCELADGSLLLMAGDCQRHWRHALPKTRRAVGGRISLTYRQVGVPSDLIR